MTGDVIRVDGVHVASIAQEVLLRRADDGVVVPPAWCPTTADVMIGCPESDDGASRQRSAFAHRTGGVRLQAAPGDRSHASATSSYERRRSAWP